MRTLLASAAILASTLAGHCLAASQVVIPFPANAVIASGSTLLVSSTIPIDKSTIYYYAFSGVVVGHGDLVGLTGTGVSLTTAVGIVDSGLLPYLSGTVLDATAKFPFTAVNKLAKGTFTFTSPAITGSATGTIRGKAGIGSKGLISGELTNVSFTVAVPHFGNLKIPKTDYLSFVNGQLVVGTGPILTGTQPDLSFELPTGLVGVGYTGLANLANQTVNVFPKLKKSVSVVVALQNAGVSPDTYTLKATAIDPGFTQEFIYKGANITSKVVVTGTNEGFVLPPDKGKTTETLATGAVATLTWKVTDKSAAPVTTTTPVLTVTSVADGTKQDAIELSVTSQ
jgi:hypothetical protein